MADLIAGIIVTFYGSDGSLDLPKTLMVNGLILVGFIAVMSTFVWLSERSNRAKEAETHERLGLERSADGTGRAERPRRTPEDF